MLRHNLDVMHIEMYMLESEDYVYAYYTIRLPNHNVSYLSYNYNTLICGFLCIMFHCSFICSINTAVGC